MPRLDNIRHERFAREYIKHGNASEAYRLAGFPTRKATVRWACSSRLLRHASVSSRIAELRRQMTYKTKISLESLMSDLDADRELARRLDQPSAAIQATVVKAKLAGLMVERKESGAPGDFASLSAEQIVAKVRADHGEDVAKLLQAALDKSEPAPSEALPEDIPPPASGMLN